MYKDTELPRLHSAVNVVYRHIFNPIVKFSLINKQ